MAEPAPVVEEPASGKKDKKKKEKKEKKEEEVKEEAAPVSEKKKDKKKKDKKVRGWRVRSRQALGSGREPSREPRDKGGRPRQAGASTAHPSATFQCCTAHVSISKRALHAGGGQGGGGGGAQVGQGGGGEAWRGGAWGRVAARGHTGSSQRNEGTIVP